MELDRERMAEIGKYSKAYQAPDYKMGERRRAAAMPLLHDAPSRRSYLDVGCGRGEMLDEARGLGFERIEGTEVVPDLLARDLVRFALAHKLPYTEQEFDIVTCMDVLEHLIPQDTVPVLKELDRITNVQLIVSANNKQSRSMGMELHVNKRPYHEWDQLIRGYTSGDVCWISKGKGELSETWVITK